MAIVTSLNDMQIGDKIACRYISTTSGQTGSFSELGTCTATPILVASSATPNGLFYFIHLGYDTIGRMKLIADRNIQHSISWNVLNTKGIASGAGLVIDLGLGTTYITSIRLTSGGTSTTDTDDEWDKIIVNSTLNGTITAGDNNVWNWSGLTSWSSTTGTTSANRITRGNTLVTTTNSPTGLATTTANATTGFRPVLTAEKLNFPPLINSLLKTLINNNRQVQISAISVSDPDVSNLVKYQVSITKSDTTVVIKREYDSVFQSNPLSFDTLSFDVSEFGIGTNTITINVIDDQTPAKTVEVSVTVIKTSSLKTLLQDGVKWKHINNNILETVIMDYTSNTAQNKEMAFLTIGMGAVITLTPTLNAQIENPNNFKVVVEKIDLLT